MATRVGRAPKEFVLDYERNVAAEFELWLEDVNDYMAICKIVEPAEKKSLFLNLAELSLRRVVKGLVVGAPGEESDEYVYGALTDAILTHFRPSTNTISERQPMSTDETRRTPNCHSICGPSSVQGGVVRFFFNSCRQW